MRSLIRLTIAGFFILAVFLPQHSLTAQENDCSGAPAPRLTVGMQGRVIILGEGLDGLLRVRDQAGVAGVVQVDMKNSDAFSVIGGPTCVDGYRWWNIVTTGGITGWLAEGSTQNYFVEPLAEPAPDPLPAAPNRLVTRLGNGSATSAAWSPDGQMLAIASSRGVWLYSPELIAIQFLEGPALAEVAWSPDGLYLAGAGEDGTLPIWDIASGQIALRIPAHSDPLRAVSWRNDGSALASVSAEPLVRVWDATTGEAVTTLDLPGAAASVRWNPAANQLAASYVGEADPGFANFIVQVWEGETFTPIQQFVDNETGHIRWSADGTQMATSYMGDLSAFTVSDGTQTYFMTNLHVGGDSDIGDFIWMPDGNLVVGFSYISAGSAFTSVTRVNRSNYEEPSYYIPTFDRSIRSLAWRPGSNQLVLIDACYISLLDGDALTLLKESPDFLMPNFAWDPAGQPVIATSGTPLRVTFVTDQAQMRIEDAVSGQIVTQITDDFFHSVDSDYALSPDKSRIAVHFPYNATIIIWELASGQRLAELHQYEFPCNPDSWGTACYIQWSGTGRYMQMQARDYSNAKSMLFIWDAQTGGNIVTTDTACDETPVWSPDDHDVACLVSGNLIVWDVTTGGSRVSAQAVDLSAYQRQRVTWKPDNTALAHVGGKEANTIIIWDAAGLQPRLELLGHTSLITALGWSPDGTRLASGDYAGTVRIWDAASGQLLLTLPGHKSQVWYFYWKPDGSQLAVVSEDHTARVWDLR